MRSHCLIYTTHPSAEQARATAQALLEGHHVACCNIIPGMESHYRWEGKLTNAAEVAMVSKTTEAQAGEAMKLIRALHPYDMPAIIQLPVTGGDAGFLGWIAKECAKDKP